ncbi:MAG: SpoIID/LytB domain-containing protein [Erysipelotrichia bacterium]|nr:SpoIID/LytB domain-containing protein [Erysipelotrichia bacterium]
MHSVKLLILLLIASITLPAFSYGQDFDQKPLTVGFDTHTDLSTLRIQAFSGDWQMTCIPVTATSPARLATHSVIVEKTLSEGEDSVLMLIPKGLIGRFSNDKDLDSGFAKVVFSGGEFLNLEFPDMPPLLLQGKIEIDFVEKNIRILNSINTAQFVVSCASRIAIGNEPEALKAIITVIRTRLKYLLENPLHKDKPYDLCNTEHCLPFEGCGYNRELVDLLVAETRNKVITFKGKSIQPRFHNTCSGKISAASDIYGVANEPYHPAHIDAPDEQSAENCYHSPNFHWKIELQKFDVLDFLALAFAAGADKIYTAWEPEKIDNNGRIYQIALKGRRPKSVSGTEFLQQLQFHFGQNSIKSMKFNIETLTRTVIFKGMGSGDGVGMCLYGADGLAKKNVSYEDILKFYYPGTEIK